MQTSGRHVIAKCGIAELPPQAAVPGTEGLLDEVYAGALSPADAGTACENVSWIDPW